MWEWLESVQRAITQILTFNFRHFHRVETEKVQLSQLLQGKDRFTHLFQTQGQNREAATIKQLRETKRFGLKTPRAPSASASVIMRES